MLNILVVFGASGDLTSRKLIPAIFQLFCRRELPEPFAVIGISRTEMVSATWRDHLLESTEKFATTEDFSVRWAEFAKILHYLPGNLNEPEMFEQLKSLQAELETKNGSPGSSNCVYYLAISPNLYSATIDNLDRAGMATESPGNRRAVIIEKPFGRDLLSARQLNDDVHRTFEEDRIFRIDHYLGKETVNNIFALRFANTIFEPTWNRNYIDNIQITANESERVGRRGAFYETAGVLRDMFQNHLLQLLTITTMEPPVRFDAKSVRDEKVKVLRSLRQPGSEELNKNTLFGQYRGYQTEPGVHAGSHCPTFAAIKLYIDNWRWKDVPIYLRSGKAMSCRTTQIVIQYREPPHLIFDDGGKYGTHPAANRLLIQIQPSEGIHLGFMSKVPGSEMQLRESELSFRFKEHFGRELPEAYTRLLLDAFTGDSSLFARNDEVEAAWEIIDPLRQWQEKGERPLYEYDPESWGPDESDAWMKEQGRQWFDLCPILR